MGRVILGRTVSILAAGKNKRSRAYNSPSFGTPAIQMEPQLPASPAPMLSDKDTKSPLLMMVGRLKKEAAAITDHITPSVLPDAQDRLSLVERVVALQQVFIQLNEYARVNANHSAPKEDLWRIVGLLEEATAAVTRRIKTSVIPDAEDRLFLMGRLAALLQVLHGGDYIGCCCCCSVS
jgi:hypothetical protein